MSKQLKNEEMEAKVMDEELETEFVDDLEDDFDEPFEEEDEDEDYVPVKRKHRVSTKKVKKAVKHYGPKILKGIGIGVALGLAYTIGVAAGGSKRQDDNIYDLDDEDYVEYVEKKPERIEYIEHHVPAIEEISEPEPKVAVEVHEEIIEGNS